jgi:hypothetical protein
LAAVAMASAVARTAAGQAVVNENQETATLYVDVVNGNDNNPGTQAEPLKTIGKSVSLAEENDQDGIGTHVYINPGLYREKINLDGSRNKDTALPETYEAVTSGTAVITGADQYTNWTPYSGNPSIYSTPWTHNWGQCPPLLGATVPPQTDILMRREMSIINGTPMEQVMALDQMVEGTFYVDDSGQQFYIWPPAGTDLNSADVELADRGQLWNITNKNGVVLRGLTFEYSADCKSQGAVQVINPRTQNILFDSDNFLWNNATGLHLFKPANFTVENVVANHNGAVGIETFASINGLWQNDTADYNNWRGEQGEFYRWAEGGIDPDSLINGTYNNITADWNFSTGVHWDTLNENTVATNITARNNFYSGVLLERNDGPMNLSNLILCNNSSEAQTLNGGMTTSAGLAIRDSENVTVTNSLMYGNGNGQVEVIGFPGGIPILDWQNGRTFTVNNANITNTNNILESTDASQATLRDAYLNGNDWLLFQSTLTSEKNTWWNGYNSTGPFVLPIPNLHYTTDFPGWQRLSGQDIDSQFTEPSGNPQSVCPVTPDMPDFWLINNYAALTLDYAGQAVYTDTVAPLDGFNGTVSLTYGGVKEVPGLSATLAPTTIANASGSTIFSIAADPSIAPGTYQLTVLANSRGVTRTTTTFLTVPATSLRFSTASLNFPNQQVNTTSSPLTVNINNIGNSPVNIASIISSSTVFAETTNCPLSLRAGQSCAVNVTFTPLSSITYLQTLTVSDDDPTSPQIIPLTGTGTAAGELSLSSYHVQFGNQVYQTTSAPQVVTATNIGTVPVVFGGDSLSGNNPGDFAFANGCGQQLDPGDNCQINLTFTPTALKNRSAALVILDNTSKGSNTINLSGYGTTAVSLSPKSLHFGQIPVGQKSAPMAVTLTNLGVTLTINSISIGGQNASSFTETNNCGNSVAMNSSCTISVTFGPTSGGNKLAKIEIADSDPTSPQTVSLAGTGVTAQLSLSSYHVAFGNQVYQTTSAPQVVTVTNIGTVPVIFSGDSLSGNDPADFAFRSGCGQQLDPGDSCQISLTFTPEALGMRSAILTVLDNTSKGSNTVRLDGKGQTAVSLSPKYLGFGGVKVGLKSAPKIVTLTNSGGTLTIHAITLGGQNAASFTQTNNCGNSVAAHSSCTINVVFTPHSSGAKIAKLQIGDSDPTSPQMVSLTGTGTN